MIKCTGSSFGNFPFVLFCGKDPMHKETRISYAPVIRAFRNYVRLGLAGDELPPYKKYMRIKGVSGSERQAASLLAVCDTLRILRLSGKHEALRAVRIVWMAQSAQPLEKKDISMRVRKASFLLYCDDRTVYRYLKTAAETYLSILAESGYRVEKP